MNNNLFEGETMDNKKVVGCYVFGVEAGKEIHTIVNQNEKQEETGEFTSYKVKPETVKFIPNKTKMQDFMLHQLLGFKLGKGGYTISELVSGAGLLKEEWQKIKKETEVTSLEKSDIEEIEEYIKEEYD